MALILLQQPTDMRTLPATLPGSSLSLSSNIVSLWNADASIAGAGFFTFSDGDLFTAAFTLAEIETADPDRLVNIRISDIDVGSTPALVNGLDSDNIAAATIALLAGDDTITGSTGSDGILAGAGNDLISGGLGGDIIDGGEGSDTASYANASAGVVVNLVAPGFNTNEASGDIYFSIENVSGSAFKDILYGGFLSNTLKGNGGNDLLVGSWGGDQLDGGAGSDTASYDTSLDGVRADLLNPGSNTGHAAGDTYTSIENLEGSTFNDVLLGDNKANVIGGNTYHDLASGRDNLFGRGGNDQLFGYDDNDRLTGGLGRDTMAGGAGIDIFDFNSTAETGLTAATRDIITDFQHLIDKIDLSTIDASTVLANNNAFVWRGTGAFTTSAAGELRFTRVDNTGTANDYTLLSGDTDADIAPEFQIRLKGLITLSLADIIV